MTQGSVVEMLWEDVDPQETLRDRFGFSTAGAATRWVGRVLAAHWGIEVSRCERLVMSDVNALAWVTTSEHHRMIAKWSIAPDRFSRLAALGSVTAWLGDVGLPVSVPVAARDGRRQIVIDGACLSVQHAVRGHVLDVTDDRLVHEAGATLARLHAGLAACPAAVGIRTGLERDEPIAQQVSEWMAGEQQHLPAGAIDELQRLLDMAVPGPFADATCAW